MSDTQEQQSETGNEFPIHILAFDSFKKFISQCSLVNRMTVYTMSSKADSYATDDKLSEFIITLNNYNKDEQWRLSVYDNLRISFSNEGIQFENNAVSFELKDSARIVVLPTINTFFIIPGENSKSFNPAQAIQLTNMFKSQPMIFNLGDRIDDMENGEKEHHLYGEFIPWEDPESVADSK